MDGPRLKLLYVSRGYTTHDRRFLTSFAGQGWQPVHVPLLREVLDSRPVPDGVYQRAPLLQREPGSSDEWSRALNGFREQMDEVRADAVIAGPLQLGAYLAALAGARPLVSVSWGSDILVDANRSDFVNNVTRFVLGRSDAVFGDCEAVRHAVLNRSNLANHQIVTFPWGVDLQRFSPGTTSLDIRRRPGWTDAIVFISTRSWEPVYAIDTLIRAFALVRKTLPQARLILLGDGSQATSIHFLVDSLGLRNFVFSPGRAPYGDLPEYFRAADVYVSSALSDGTSVSLLEAMATGLPVVVSDSYGNVEWVTSGVNGELAQPGNHDSLASAMVSVAGDPAKRSAMGARNVDLARERADWERNFPQLVQMVERLAGATARR